MFESVFQNYSACANMTVLLLHFNTAILCIDRLSIGARSKGECKSHDRDT